MERCMLHASDDALFQCESELTQTDQSISAEADNRSNPSEMEIRAPKHLLQYVRSWPFITIQMANIRKLNLLCKYTIVFGSTRLLMGT